MQLAPQGKNKFRLNEFLEHELHNDPSK